MIKWHTEELPDTTRNVLIYLLGGKVSFGYFYKGFWFYYPEDRDSSIEMEDEKIWGWADMPDGPQEAM